MRVLLANIQLVDSILWEYAAWGAVERRRKGRNYRLAVLTVGRTGPIKFRRNRHQQDCNWRTVSLPWHIWSGFALLIAACGEAQPQQALDNLKALGGGSASGTAGCVLRDAIASAEPGDTINVPPGVYSLLFGELLINKDITLIGAGLDKTITEAAEAPGDTNHRVLRVSFGDMVTISGTTFQNGVEDSKEERMTIFLVLPGTGIHKC